MFFRILDDYFEDKQTADALRHSFSEPPPIGVSISPSILNPVDTDTSRFVFMVTTWWTVRMGQPTLMLISSFSTLANTRSRVIPL